MSFRTRLAVFFVLMVAIPIGAIAVLASDVTGDSQAGKADASLATGLKTAVAFFEDSAERAGREGRALLESPAFVEALQSRDADQVARAAGEAPGIEYLAITAPGVGDVTPVPSEAPFATAVTTDQTGDLRVVTSVTSAAGYVETVEELTGLTASVVAADGEQVTGEGVDVGVVPAAGNTATTDIGGEEARAATVSVGDERSSVTVLAPVEGGGFLDSRPRIAIVVSAFLALALLGVAFIARSIQSQITAMLGAARRIGAGDFSKRVPVVGNDEMAGLASEFNKMTDQLEEQIGELRHQRTELDRSVRRLGEAFAAGLDRRALLKIVAETALGACNAEYARVSLDGSEVIEAPSGYAGTARDATIAGQKRADREAVKVDVRRAGGVALAAPLTQLSHGVRFGSLSVGRQGKAFSDSDRDVFLYLIGQASASIENISVHERVSEQAVTDELTRLPNDRAFRETLDREAARAKRFGHELSLVILDLDNFKLVNDTYGHLQGDEVLRLIGKFLLEEARAIDQPARYGGEEFVVALPETGTDGAIELAERIRERLDAEEIPLLDGSGAIKVTASFGTATIPLSATTVHQLFAAADDALYVAKRSGKNRVMTAPEKVSTAS